MSLPFVTARGCRGGSFAANASGGSTAEATVTRQSDLVGWWPLNATSGSTVADSTDTGNDGTATNMEDVDWVTGVNGNCLAFDGSNERVEFSGDAGYPTEDFSMSCWFNLATTGAYRTILCAKHYYWSARQGNWIFRLNGTNGVSPTMALNCYNGTSNICNKTESITISTDEWHHGGFVHNATSNTAHLFYDGSELGSGTAIAHDLENLKDDGFTIGVQSYGTASRANYWAGTVDDVRLYNGVLTASDFADVYNSGSGDWP